MLLWLLSSLWDRLDGFGGFCDRGRFDDNLRCSRLKLRLLSHYRRWGRFRLGFRFGLRLCYWLWFRHWLWPLFNLGHLLNFNLLLLGS